MNSAKHLRCPDRERHLLRRGTPPKRPFAMFQPCPGFMHGLAQSERVDSSLIPLLPYLNRPSGMRRGQRQVVGHCIDTRITCRNKARAGVNTDQACLPLYARECRNPVRRIRRFRERESTFISPSKGQSKTPLRAYLESICSQPIHTVKPSFSKTLFRIRDELSGHLWRHVSLQASSVVSQPGNVC